MYNASYAEEQLHKFCDFFLCVQYDSDLGDMTLSQGHDRSLGHGQQMSEVSFKSKLPVKSYDANTEFRYVCTVTLNLELWPWVKVMTHPWVMDNNCVKYYPNPTCDLDLGDMTLGQGHDTPLGHRQQMSEVLFKSKLPVKVMARTLILAM